MLASSALYRSRQASGPEHGSLHPLIESSWPLSDKSLSVASVLQLQLGRRQQFSTRPVLRTGRAGS